MLYFLLLLFVATTHCQETLVNNTRWEKYLAAIDKAVNFFEDCMPNDHHCICHESQMNDDLKSFTREGITKEVFEKTKHLGVHYQVIKGRLYRQHECSFPARCQGIEYFLKKIAKELPNIEIVVNVQDVPMANKKGPRYPVFSFSKISSDYWDLTYPAWSFWSGGPAVWPIYPTGLGRWDLQRKSISSSAEQYVWSKKKSKGFFRGSRTSAERDPLILLSRKEPSLIDAQYTKNQAWKSDEDTLGAPAATEVKLEDHCPYKYLFNVRGVAASFRLKHLFLCGSLIFHPSDDQWIEFFYPSLFPWVHYVPVKKDLSDVKEMIEFARENDEVVRKIAKRGRKFIVEHLKMADVFCYWRKLLMRYSLLLKYRPTLNPRLKEIDKIRDEL